jgi:hypothetical protein
MTIDFLVGLVTQKQLLFGTVNICGELHHVHFKLGVGLSAVARTHFDADDFDC